MCVHDHVCFLCSALFRYDAYVSGLPALTASGEPEAAGVAGDATVKSESLGVCVCVCVCVCVWLSHTLHGTNDRLVRRYEVLVLFSRKNFQVCRCVAMCCQAGSWLRCVSYPTGAKAVRGERFAPPQQFHARVSLGCGLFRSVEVLLTCFHSPPRVAPPPCHPPHVSRPSIALHRNSPQCAKPVKVKSEDEEHCTQGFVAIGRKGTLLIC